ncbi:hypothetical protein NDA10_002337 [Ustilago hordei]|nr:hypothetical protein NDA10_002337 [Ustilago hordei]
MSSSPPSHSPSSSSSNAPLPGLKEQWSQLNELLPPSSDDNQIVSTSSPLLLKVSAMLHDRLSHFERNKWPLDRIYEFLDSFFKSHPNLHHRSPQSKQVADPTTPVKPTSVLPQQALENTPRTSKATSLLAQLRRIEDWDFLISFHKMACDMYSRDKSWSPGQLSLMVDRLIKHQSKFCAVIPELKNVFNDVTTPVVDQLATVYNNLTSRFPTFNSPDQALAVVIVHLAQSHVKHSRDPEVIGTSIHLENGFYRPYCGDAPNCFLTFVSHLNAVYDKLDANEPQPYFRGTPIVQSSGTGKTRCHGPGCSRSRRVTGSYGRSTGIEDLVDTSREHGRSAVSMETMDSYGLTCKGGPSTATRRTKLKEQAQPRGGPSSRSRHSHEEDQAQGACRWLPLRGSRDKSQRNCH